ncbi:MAG: prolyl oligopeptidase family serine peptidase [Planctomycetaceae bacterium]|nr:prolyl oligopeptidase family serine peptidase [Planctomycetaceae bacterium]
MLRTITLLFALLVPSVAFGADALPKTPEKFEVDGHTGMLFAAPTPAAGKPWVWYFPTIKGMSIVLRRVYFEGFLNAGISIAGYDLGEVRGAPGSTEQFHKFYTEMVRRGYSSRPILLGQSRGGLMALAWAMRHPEQTRAFVGIYPVCNLQTWGLKNMPVALADYQMTEAELRSRVAEFNPLDNLQALLKHKVPMFVVQGDSDKAVPHLENAMLLKERYEAGGGPITVKMSPGLGHEAVPEFFEDQDLLAFVLKQAAESK